MTRVELAIVIALAAGLFAILYPAIQQTRNPQGPHGEMYPSSYPTEANRIKHANGASIILPKNWDDLSPEFLTSPFLRIAARCATDRSLKSFISVAKCHNQPDPKILAEFHVCTFKTFPAYESCRVARRNTFDDSAMSVYELYVNQQETWWSITFTVADEMPVLPGSIRQYIETIEFSESE